MTWPPVYFAWIQLLCLIGHIQTSQTGGQLYSDTYHYGEWSQNQLTKIIKEK